MVHRNKYNSEGRTYVVLVKVANQNQAPVNQNVELVEALGFSPYVKGHL